MTAYEDNNEKFKIMEEFIMIDEYEVQKMIEEALNRQMLLFQKQIDDMHRQIDVLKTDIEILKEGGNL
jgi:hypothetical protein